MVINLSSKDNKADQILKRRNEEKSNIYLENEKNNSNPILLIPSYNKNKLDGRYTRPDSGKLVLQEKLIDSQTESIVRLKQNKDNLVSYK